jgi:hypothetical protein
MRQGGQSLSSVDGMHHDPDAPSAFPPKQAITSDVCDYSTDTVLSFLKDFSNPVMLARHVADDETGPINRCECYGIRIDRVVRLKLADQLVAYFQMRRAI